MKLNVPSALAVTVGSALPLGLDTSMRATFSCTPDGSGTVAVILPVTVSLVPRVPLEGALTVRVGTLSLGPVKAFRV
ncbi:hypothetical protein [Streptomyces fragilis]|uniref:hypothetical protein n=1 Tax=Streptomyces fragilis TaxID=67301 RepID=UPI0024DE4546|nr:hypothetical protein [Streptomyces fragilis]